MTDHTDRVRVPSLVRECIAALRQARCDVYEPAVSLRQYLILLPDGQTRELGPHVFALLCYRVYREVNGP